MSKIKWEVVEQTFQISDSGKRTLVTEKHVRLEGVPEKIKNYIDIGLKLLGVLAIFLPLFLIYYQQKSEIIKEKKLSLNKTAAEITKSLILLENNDVDSNQYQFALSSLRTDFGPQFKIYGNDSLASTIKYLYLYKKASTIMREYAEWYSVVKEDMEEIVKPFTNNGSKFRKDTVGFVLNLWKNDSIRLKAIFEKLNFHNGNKKEKINYEVNFILNEMGALDSKIYNLYSNSFNQVLKHFTTLINVVGIGERLSKFFNLRNNTNLFRDSIINPVFNLPSTIDYHYSVVKNLKIPLFDSLFHDTKLKFEKQLENALK